MNIREQITRVVTDLVEEITERLRTDLKERVAEAWDEGNKAKKGSANPYRKEEKK